MANSYIEYTASGTGTNGLGQNTFSYSGLDALNDTDIKVFGQKADGTKDILTIASQNTSAKTITLSAIPASGYYTEKVRLYRSTTSNALVDFVDGARLTESDLDTAYKQGLFVAQEVSEDAAGIGTTSTNNLSLSGTTTVANLTATGTVSIPATNYAKAYVSNYSAQTIAANQWVDVVLNVEHIDTASAFASNTFTPPSTAYYCIQGQVNVQCDDANELSTAYARIAKGGNALAGTTQGISETHATNSNMTFASISTFAIASLTSSDPIKLQVNANSGAGNLSVVSTYASLGIFQLA